MKFRAIFISDVHLGTKGSQAKHLLSFIKDVEAETIYLVGDIVDGWRLKRGWYWPQSHNDLVQKLLRKVRKGTRIVYIAGNHDEFLRDFVDQDFGGIEIKDQVIHTSENGMRYLVIHGDQFDAVVMHAKWLAFIGDWAYELALFLNAKINFLRRKMGFSYWSFSAWAKHSVKRAVNFIGAFEAVLTNEARRQAVDGVICGHIHHAIIREIDSMTYMNCGDWVESCTALVETIDGEFRIIDWLQDRVVLTEIATQHDIKMPAQTPISAPQPDKIAA
jgi:UDP-2,3-diacylglucosamine pyrophosphatase LpxH